jgi:O-antigen/teichoic acid export membrane protein
VRRPARGAGALRPGSIAVVEAEAESGATRRQAVLGPPPAPLGEGPSQGTVPGAGHFVRTVAKFGLAQPLTWASSAAMAVLLPRFLGDASLGKYGFALGLTLLAGLLANLGVGALLTREVARAPHRAGELAVNALLMRVPLSLVAALVPVAIVTATSRDPLTRTVVLVLSAGILVDATRAVVQGTLQGLHRMTSLAVFPAVAGAAYAVGAGVALFRGAGVVVVAAAFVAGQTAGLAVNAVALWRALPRAPRPSWQACRLIFFGSLPFFVWQAALVVYGQVDSVLLSYLTNDAVVGWYVAAYRVVTMPIFVPTVLMTVVFPALSAAAGDPTRFNQILRQAVRVVLLTTVPMALGIVLLPDRIVAALHWSDSFQHSIAPIMLLAPSFPLVAVDMMIGTALSAHDRQRQWALTGVAAAVLNPSLNLLAIPYMQHRFGNGAIGAAAVTTITELFMLVVGLWLLPRGSLGRSTGTWALRCMGASLAMAAAVVPLRGFFIAVPIAAGVLVYGAASLALRTLSPSDVRSALGHLVDRTHQREAERAA